VIYCSCSLPVFCSYSQVASRAFLRIHGQPRAQIGLLHKMELLVTTSKMQMMLIRRPWMSSPPSLGVKALMPRAILFGHTQPCQGPMHLHYITQAPGNRGWVAAATVAGVFYFYPVRMAPAIVTMAIPAPWTAATKQMNVCTHLTKAKLNLAHARPMAALVRWGNVHKWVMMAKYFVLSSVVNF